MLMSIIPLTQVPVQEQGFEGGGASQGWSQCGPHARGPYSLISEAALTPL